MLLWSSAAAAPLLRSAQRRAAIDRYLPAAGRSAANPPHADAAVDRWDRQIGRQTEGQTDGHRTVT